MKKLLSEITHAELIKVCGLCGHDPLECRVSYNNGVFIFAYPRSTYYTEQEELPYKAADLLRSLGYQIENVYEKEVEATVLYDEVRTKIIGLHTHASISKAITEHLRTNFKLIKIEKDEKDSN